jgi:IPT/TIG domain-containing protein
MTVPSPFSRRRGRATRPHAAQRSLGLLRRGLRSRRAAMTRRGGRDETGAVLILALVFLVAVSVIVGALTEWTTNDLANSLNFKTTQTVNADATNAVNLAIQNIRFTPLLYTSQVVNGVPTLVSQTLNASPPNYCWGSSTSQEFNMNVYCSTVWNPTSANTRQVTVSACPSRTASWTAAQTSCPASPFLQAVVTFDDYPPGVSSPSEVECVAYCGNSVTVDSWSWAPTVPTVSNVTNLSGSSVNTSIDGGQQVTITGSGFTSGSTVNFVDTNALDQVNNSDIQQVVPATNVSVNVGAQTITATTPGVTTLANYYVTVTTPGAGTSAVNSAFQFDYTASAPVVTNLTPTSGYTTHGTAITITGSGFINGATVSMVQESNGTPVSPLTTFAATAVQIVSNTQITAITYPVTNQNTSWFVTVTTSSGASAYVTAATFTFTPAPA